MSAAAAPSVELFFQEPLLGDAELSPSGKHVAMRVSQKGSHNRLAVLDVETMQSTVAVSFKDSDVAMFHWVNDDRLVVNQTTTLVRPGRVDAAPGLFGVNRDGTGFKALVRTDGFGTGAWIGREMLPWYTHWYRTDPGQRTNDVFVVRPEGRDRRAETYYANLIRLDTVSGAGKDLDVPARSIDWLLDPQGQPRAATVLQANRVTLLWRDAKGAWAPLGEWDLYATGALSPEFIAPDGHLFVSGRHGDDKAALYEFDVERRALVDKPLVAAPGFDVDADVIANDQALLGVRYAIDAVVTQWFDPRMKAVQDRVDAALPATVNEITPPRRPATPYVLVESYSDVQPVTFYLFNTETAKFVKLGASLPALDAKALGTTDFVRYKARDGLEIPAWLTLPPGEKKKDLPLVVLVHGGPWVRGSVWGFHPEVQFLASRGYAVLQPEFRGSTGFGEKHFQAGLKQWGQAMQDDIADGVTWAVAQGHADTKRVCIGGASYGGYATLMGLIRDPDLYRCGFEWVGVTDLSLLDDSNWSDVSTVFQKYGMPQLVGDPQADAAMLKAASPLAQADRLKRPLLMAHGAFDIRVPIVHGERMRDALKARGAELEWVVYDEGHGWQKPETQVDFWTRVERFLDRHIGH